ncbi:MAG: hypothetical protein A2W91_05640 [Bacteroidetes bacterium GWF2_38_335]|nr:MAG: hypothetical protein A2W91_05640 [Bacteroidetes bacterium GWF2_38_335]HBS88908.1 hypothetical protein [Bacteroidales bacterium]
MKKIYIIILLISITYIVNGATFYSVRDGLGNSGTWSNGGYWSYTLGGAPCGTTPGASDIIYIDEDMTLDINFSARGTLTIMAGATLSGPTKNLEIRGGATFNSYGTLEIYDLIFYNGSFANLYSTSVTNVLNDFTNMNNSDDVIVDGSVSVTGEFYNGNGGIIIGSGSISADTFTGTGTTFGISPNSSIPPHSTVPTALPIELLSLEVLTGNNNEAIIEWATLTEINNDFFTIEKTTDGVIFYVVTTVKGAGNSSEILHYAVTDNEPSDGLSYYRLRQTDFDGTTTVSQLAVFNNSFVTGGEMIVYPNPIDAVEKINLNLTGLDPEKEVLVVVNDITGRILYSKVLFTDLSGDVLEAVDPGQNLPSGTYFIVGTSNDKIYQKRFIIR